MMKPMTKQSLTAIVLLVMLAFASSTTVSAQRLQQKMGRGVVAVKNGSNATITWRRFAQEPEDAKYNVYVNGTKLNSSPLSNTNYATQSSLLPAGAKVTVTLVKNGVEQEQSGAYIVKNYDLRNIFVDIHFERGGSPLQSSNFDTSYVWPVDLDGDGEMDYVVNRINNTNRMDCYVEGYLSSGEHLWTVKLGPNELSCSGQDDQICAYDIDCDGKGELIVQTSDGTQFWDPDKKTFGLFVNGNTTGDTDGDGIIDYEKQSVKNAPRYMTVVDGMTGREKASVEQTYTSDYTRTNRASLMGDEYSDDESPMMEEDGTTKIVDLPEKGIYICNDSVVFQYQQYEVAPYAFGMPCTSISLKDMKANNWWLRRLGVVVAVVSAL